MAKKSLLQQAKEVTYPRLRGKKPAMISDEEIDLIVAFLKGEVTVRQAYTVLYPKDKLPVGSGKFYARIVPVLREAVSRGKLKTGIK